MSTSTSVSSWRRSPPGPCQSDCNFSRDFVEGVTCSIQNMNNCHYRPFVEATFSASTVPTPHTPPPRRKYSRFRPRHTYATTSSSYTLPFMIPDDDQSDQFRDTKSLWINGQRPCDLDPVFARQIYFNNPQWFNDPYLDRRGIQPPHPSLPQPQPFVPSSRSSSSSSFSSSSTPPRRPLPGPYPSPEWDPYRELPPRRMEDLSDHEALLFRYKYPSHPLNFGPSYKAPQPPEWYNTKMRINFFKQHSEEMNLKHRFHVAHFHKIFPPHRPLVDRFSPLPQRPRGSTPPPYSSPLSRYPELEGGTPPGPRGPSFRLVDHPIVHPVETPFDSLPPGVAPAFTIDDDLCYDTFTSSTSPEEDSLPHQPSSFPFPQGANDVNTSSSTLYPPSTDTTSLLPSDSFDPDEGFLADHEEVSLVIPHPPSPTPSPVRLRCPSPYFSSPPTPNIFQRCWNWVKSW